MIPLNEELILKQRWDEDYNLVILEVAIGSALGYEDCDSSFILQWEFSTEVKQLIETYHQMGWADAKPLNRSPLRCPTCGAMKVVKMLDCPHCSWSYD